MSVPVDDMSGPTSLTSEQQPIPNNRLEEIANATCDLIFASVTEYEHSKTQDWNSNIINNFLKSLISETSTSTKPPLYKFAVTCTIIQHVIPPRSSLASGDDPKSRPSQSAASIGRRGMHSASGAYWNNLKDGMWHWKYNGTDVKGFDVVLSVIWVTTV